MYMPRCAVSLHLACAYKICSCGYFVTALLHLTVECAIPKFISILIV